MGLTDINSPHVLTTSRLTEEALIQTIVRGIVNEMDLIQAGKYPDAAKIIAKDVNILYIQQIIEAYHKGMKDGSTFATAIDFSLLEKQVDDYEEKHGPIETEPIVRI